MIRTQKIFAEANAPNTVIVKNRTVDGHLVDIEDKYMIDGPVAGNAVIAHMSTVIATDSDKNITYPNNRGVNKILVTDENGKLQWIGG